MEIRLSATSLNRVADALDSRIKRITQRVEATHRIVQQGLSNVAPQGRGSQIKIRTIVDFKHLVEYASPVGKLSMYAASVAFRSKKGFKRDELFSLMFEEPAYCFGWFMALDAVQLIGIIWRDEDGRSLWEIPFVAGGLLEELRLAADSAEPAVEGGNLWNKESIGRIDAYFSGLGAPQLEDSGKVAPGESGADA